MAYLEHVGSKESVSADRGKISAVADWPIPQNLSDLCAFLDMAGYYCQYVEDLAVVHCHQLTGTITLPSVNC